MPATLTLENLPDEVYTLRPELRPFVEREQVNA